MKIVFEGSELKEGIIKVSLDGGFTFADYDIADVKESGIPLDDSQRYDKIKVKGPANVLKSLDIVSNVKVEGGIDEDNSLPITPIYYQLYDGGCGYGFRLKEADCGYYPNYTFNPEVLYVQIDDSYTSLSSLCEYDGHFYTLSNTADFTGDLYVKADIPGSCPYESYYIRVPFRLEEWK